MEVKELDKIKCKDGRIGTVMLISSCGKGAVVEFDDTAPETETIKLIEVIEVLE
jgi:hypothetical protein